MTVPNPPPGHCVCTNLQESDTSAHKLYRPARFLAAVIPPAPPLSQNPNPQRPNPGPVSPQKSGPKAPHFSTPASPKSPTFHHPKTRRNPRPAFPPKSGSSGPEFRHPKPRISSPQNQPKFVTSHTTHQHSKANPTNRPKEVPFSPYLTVQLLSISIAHEADEKELARLEGISAACSQDLYLLVQHGKWKIW